MAEGFVNVTEGSGKKLHTWNRTIGANDVHDEFVLPGAYPIPTYIVNAVPSVATSNDHLLTINAGASLNVRIHRIRIEDGANATTATLAGLDILRTSAVAPSGGSAVTAVPMDTADAASATSRSLPTTKGTEGLVVMRVRMIFRQAILTTAAQTNEIWEWTQSPFGKPLIIPAGTLNGIAVKIGTGVAAANANVTIEFSETAFL